MKAILPLFTLGYGAVALLFAAGRMRGVARLVLAAAVHRSPLRLRLAIAEFRGFAAGLVRGFGQTW